MYTEPELLNERLERLAIVLDEIMPHCALLVRDALARMKEQDEQIESLKQTAQSMMEGITIMKQPEIVRCKDCRFGSVWNNCILCDGVNGAHSPDWYCADGERKTDY